MADFKKLLQSPVQVSALGGLGEVGKNMYCIENSQTMLLIDCGVMFPDDSMPGIDYVIPDFTHVVENIAKSTALVITHGHEDHIGGIPFLLQRVEIPFIYAPKISAALIRKKIQDSKIQTLCKIVEYDEDSKITIGDFKIEFFKVTHSIPDAFGLYIQTPQGTIIQTGDFKIDLTPVDGDFNISKLVKYGDKGVDLLMADSTNAEKEGYTDSENVVVHGLNEAFKSATGRVIVTTFSSNIARINEIVELSIKNKRIVVPVGRSIESNVEVARASGYIKASDDNFAKVNDLNKIPNNEVTIVCTGTQGEELAVLSKISRGEHKYVKAIPGDTVVFSSSVIPGNTSSVNKIKNALSMQGVNVISSTSDLKLHASGHASKQEMRLLQKLIRPKNFMPIHGEYRMLKLHAGIALQCGLREDKAFVLQNGDVLNLINHRVTKGSPIQADNVYIDGKNPIGITSNIMKERTMLVNEGVVSISMLLDLQEGKIVTHPQINSRGFSSVIAKSFKTKCQMACGLEITKFLDDNPHSSFLELKQFIRTFLSKYLYREFHRSPIIVPVIYVCNGDKIA